MSQRSRNRLRRMRERRARDHDTESAFASIKAAGMGAAILIFIAVAVGFRGEVLSDTFGGRLSALSGLLQPGFLGLTALEWIAFALAGALIALFVWRGLRR